MESSHTISTSSTSSHHHHHTHNNNNSNSNSNNITSSSITSTSKRTSEDVEGEIIPSKKVRDVSCLKDYSKIGAGTFGDVYLAIDVVSGERVAIKRIKMEQESLGFPVTAIREIKILQALKVLNHPNIVRLREIVTADTEASKDSISFEAGSVFMVFEYAEFDLSGLLASKYTFSNHQIKSYMKQLLNGIHYMHVNQILHRDLKCANILLTRENVLKIADWGLARCVPQKQRALTNPVVTLWYRSPELLLNSRMYGPAIDIWSAGCIFAELLEKKALFMGKDELSQLSEIYKIMGTPVEGSESTARLKKCEGWETMKDALGTGIHSCILRDKFIKHGAEAYELLEKLLVMNPDKRITASDALDFSYFWVNGGTMESSQLPRISLASAHEHEVRVKYEEAAKANASSGGGHHGHHHGGRGGHAHHGHGRGGGGGRGAPSGRIGTGSSKYRIVVDTSKEAKEKEKEKETKAPHSSSDNQGHHEKKETHPPSSSPPPPPPPL